MGRITLLDGAVGTTLWSLADAQGVKREPVWKYNIEHPELVSKLHETYIAAGSEIILANTFGANRQMVKRASSYSVSDVVKKGGELAVSAAKGTGVKVFCAIGPLLEFMEPYGDLEEEEVIDIFTEQMTPVMEAGADGVMVQTFMDLATAAVATKVAKKFGKPVFTTLTFEKRGKTMMGNSVEQVCEELEEAGADAIGMNCSLGPELALPIIEKFRACTSLPLVFKPNAGLPMNAEGTEIPYTAEQFAKEVAPALDFVSYIGGCCNCNFDYISTLKKMI